jgi:hypothetical protein
MRETMTVAMRVGALLGLFLLALAPRTASAGAGSARAKVRYVSAKRAYIDAGTVEGLRVGSALKILRKERTVGSCTVDQVGDHRASCPSAAGHVGDQVAFDKVAPSPQSQPAVLPSPPTARDLNVAHQALSAAANELVDFHGTTGLRSLTQGLPAVTLTVSHDAYVSTGGQYQQERLDLSLNGVSIRWAGFRAYAHITAVIATVRPDNQRFRPTEIAQLYVWETAFVSREVGRPFVIGVGRIAPYHTPGLSLLDGAQLGWRNKDGNIEAGVYGGTVPDSIALFPSNHYTGGAYYSHTIAHSPKSKLRLLQHEGRLGLRGAPDVGIGPQLELEWAIQAAFGSRVDIGAQVRGSIGAGDWHTPRLEAARLHIALRPIDSLRIILTGRYLGPRPVDFDVFGTVHYFLPSDQYFTTEHMVHGTLDAIWDIRRWISLGIQAGADYDSQSSNGREYFGPELAFPTVFGKAGGLSLGYREELGWYAGREANVQYSLMSNPRFRVMARLSYFEDRLGGGFSSPAQRELGLFAMGEGRIVKWFAIRASLLGRVGVQSDSGGLSSPVPSGLNARIDLIGSL